MLDAEVAGRDTAQIYCMLDYVLKRPNYMATWRFLSGHKPYAVATIYVSYISYALLIGVLMAALSQIMCGRA